MVTYKAITVIGIAVERSKFYKKGKERGCEHPETAGKHCAECGAAMWIDVDDLLVFDDFTPGEDETFKGFAVIDPSYDGYSTSHLYIGWTRKADDNKGIMFALLPGIEKLATELRETLEPIGVWNNNFGMYTILACS